MDPEIALDNAEDAIEDGDWENAEAALTAYAEWRADGGFEPQDGDERFHQLIHEYESEYKRYKGERL